jgi:hypothetical protein
VNLYDDEMTKNELVKMWEERARVPCGDDKANCGNFPGEMAVKGLKGFKFLWRKI